MRSVLLAVAFGLCTALTLDAHDTAASNEVPIPAKGLIESVDATRKRYLFSPLEEKTSTDEAMLLESEASAAPQPGVAAGVLQPNRRTTKPLLATMEYQGPIANGPDCKIKTRARVYQYRKLEGTVYGDASRFFKVTDNDCTEGGQDTIPIFRAINAVNGASVLTADPNELKT